MTLLARLRHHVSGAIERGEAEPIVEITPATIRAACAAAGLRHGAVWTIAGPAHAARRQALLSALLGRKCSRAEAGITRIEAELFALSRVTGSCLAVRRSELSDWLARA